MTHYPPTDPILVDAWMRATATIRQREVLPLLRAVERAEVLLGNTLGRTGKPIRLPYCAQQALATLRAAMKRMEEKR